MSSAAAGLCMWAINITSYYEAVCHVYPLRVKLQDAEKVLAEAAAEHAQVQAQVSQTLFSSLALPLCRLLAVCL